MNQNTLKSSLTPLVIHGQTYQIARLSDLDSLGDWRRLPFALKVLLENLWRHCDGVTITVNDLLSVMNAVPLGFENTDQEILTQESAEIGFRPARVLMQDFTGVPAVVDLAAMRDAMAVCGGSVDKINPLIPVDLVIDHSVMVDVAGTKNALAENVAIEFNRNAERYEFLKWATKAFSNFRVVPPGTGICHQVNLEYLAQVIFAQKTETGETLLYPDTVVGTDSHTTMVNGLSVLGWGVGGIEAEAAMLGQPISMLIPKVLGVQLTGTLPAGCTATDLVLLVTQVLRKKGVVGMFVEFYGSGVDVLSLADRATIANMAPEYGATCGIFAIDDETLAYMRLTGRSDEQIAIVEGYAKAQGLWRDDANPVHYNETLSISLNDAVPAVAGPKRPQDRVALSQLKETANALVSLDTKKSTLNHHDVVLAAITSCTNTSNPAVLIAAGLVAKKARALGLKTKPWVKTSFAPGSQVVGDYLEKAGLMESLQDLGFHIVGYGCTTCIGNSGPLNPEIVRAIEDADLTVSGVLSGNRNFEGRINPHIKANYLASPPLVVAFALAGTTHIDLTTEPVAYDPNGKPIMLSDIWPSREEIDAVIKTVMTPDLFKKRYQSVFDGDANWQAIKALPTQTYQWNDVSTYVKNPPYFNGMQAIEPGNIKGARLLALLGDSITTDHISPAGNIKANGPAGSYLMAKGVGQDEFNSYGARRGNHEIMMRGTFANIRLQNECVPEQTGGVTRYYGATNLEPLPIFDAAMKYQQENIPLIIIAGREYGTGSSRDWAAKGTRLLGVRAVIAESFERIHRSNLVGMGILPLVFTPGVTRKTLGLNGDEHFDITGFDEKGTVIPGMLLTLTVHKNDGSVITTQLICRVDTIDEVAYMNAGGILPYVLENLK